MRRNNQQEVDVKQRPQDVVYQRSVTECDIHGWGYLQGAIVVMGNTVRGRRDGGKDQHAFLRRKADEPRLVPCTVLPDSFFPLSHADMT